MRRGVMSPQFTPAKVGTQPCTIILDRRQKLEVGKLIRFKRPCRGETNFRYVKWETGEVDNLEPLRITLM